MHKLFVVLVLLCASCGAAAPCQTERGVINALETTSGVVDSVIQDDDRWEKTNYFIQLALQIGGLLVDVCEEVAQPAGSNGEETEE